MFLRGIGLRAQSEDVLLLSMVFGRWRSIYMLFYKQHHVSLHVIKHDATSHGMAPWQRRSSGPRFLTLSSIQKVRTLL